jgi:hypothetical protein
MTRSGSFDALDVLSERCRLRAELTRLQVENKRLRSALIADVLTDVHRGSKHASDETSFSRNEP